MNVRQNLAVTIIFVLTAMFCIPHTCGQSRANQHRIDSLQSLLDLTSANDPQKIIILKDLMKSMINKDAKLAVEYGEQAVAIAENLDLPVDPMIYVYIARAYDRMPDNDKALSGFRTAMILATAGKDTLTMAKIHNATGFHFYNLRNVPAALLEFNKALDYARIINDTSVISEAWFGKVLSYNIFEEFDGMFAALQQYIMFADTSTEKRRLSDAYRLLGTYFRSKNNFVNAIGSNQRSFEIAKEIGDSMLMGAALNHMAWYTYEMGDLEKSLDLYNKNLGFYKPGGSNELANVYGNIGNIYRDWERYPEAIYNYNKSIELSEKSNDIYNLSWLYADISKLYERTGDYRQAYENQVLATIYGDSLASLNYQQIMAGARAQYEADKTAKELELVSMKLQRNKLITWISVGGIALLAVFTILLINRARYKARQRIQDMNHTISELNQTNLRQQMNPHFIFNTLNSIQYYVFQNDKIASNNYMTKFASLIRKTLENSRHTHIPIKEELDALHLYLELEELRFKEKFDWTIRVDDEIDTLAYKIPTMLIQPYVENAITHGLMNKEQGKGYLQVELQLQNDRILCTVEDNGIGRAKAYEIKRGKNGNHLSLGTNITESRLKLVNEIYGTKMAVLYTDLTDENGDPAGTKVEITIPIIT